MKTMPDMETRSSCAAQNDMTVFPGACTALGTLLSFLGTAFQRGDALLGDKGAPIREDALRLLPAWRDFAGQSGLEPLSCEVDALKAALIQVHADEAIRQNSRYEYNRLFHAPDLPVPVWESLWLSSEKLLFTEETTAVRRWYRRFGLDIAGVGYEAEDHLGLELAFCGWLYDAACRSAEKNDPAQLAQNSALPNFDALQTFIAEHPGRWTPLCIARLRDATNDAFWQALFGTGLLLVTSLACPGE